MANEKHIKDLVSVVIPSFNHKKYIGAAIDSVLNQSYANLECIVVDDGSTDGTVEYLKGNYSGEQRLRIHTQENHGAHYTINRAINQSRGEYISILNSDDVYSLTRLETFVGIARKQQDASLLISDVSVIDDHGALLLTSDASRYYDSLAARLEGVSDKYSFLLGNIAMTTSNFFFHRMIYDKVGSFRNLRYTHDWDWALRCAEAQGFVRVRQPLLHYRVHRRNTLSEGNFWKHVAENSVVFAAVMLRRRYMNPADGGGGHQNRLMSYLLQNESFLPVTVLYLLATRDSEQQLFDDLADGLIEPELVSLQHMSDLPQELYQSPRSIAGRLEKVTGCGIYSASTILNKTKSIAKKMLSN